VYILRRCSILPGQSCLVETTCLRFSRRYLKGDKSGQQEHTCNTDLFEQEFIINRLSAYPYHDPQFKMQFLKYPVCLCGRGRSNFWYVTSSAGVLGIGLAHVEDQESSSPGLGVFLFRDYQKDP
jgi:hypothetical protein